MFAYQRSFNIRRALCAGRFFDTDSLDDALLDFPAQVSGPQGFSYAEMRVLVEQALLSVPDDCWEIRLGLRSRSEALHG